jgi:hypothetical protein
MTGMEKLVPQIIAQPLAGTSLPDYAMAATFATGYVRRIAAAAVEAVIKQRKELQDLKRLLGMGEHPSADAAHDRCYAMPRPSAMETFGLGSRSKPAWVAIALSAGWP